VTDQTNIKNGSPKISPRDRLKESFPSPLTTLFLVIIILYGLGMRLLTATAPLDTVIGACLADDAFYYLEIAKNILAGNGATFDGVIKTNGFHPLYMALCVLINALVTPESTPKAAMIFLSFIGALNIFLLYLLGKKLGGETAGIGAAFFWAIHPFTQFIELMGVEAPLALALILTTCLWWLRIKKENQSSTANWIILGILTGLCFLGRTDSIFFIFPLAIEVIVVFRHKINEQWRKIFLSGVVSFLVISPWLIWNLVNFERITQDSGRSILQLTRALNKQQGITFLTSFTEQLPTATYSYFLKFFGYFNYSNALLVLFFISFSALFYSYWQARTGNSLWQGPVAFLICITTLWAFYRLAIMPFINDQNLLPYLRIAFGSVITVALILVGAAFKRAGKKSFFIGAILATGTLVLGVIFSSTALFFTAFTSPFMQSLFVTFLILPLFILSIVINFDKNLGVIKGAPALLFAALAAWGFYNFVFITRKYWYFLPLLAAMAIVFGRILEIISKKSNQMSPLVFLSLLLLLCFGWFDRAKGIEINGFHSWQRDYLFIAESLNKGRVENIEKEAVLGAWNSGIYGAYSGHRVINLDGVVNPHIHDVIKQKRFLSYIKESGIKYLVDHEIMFNTYSTFSTVPFYNSLKLVKRFKQKSSAGDIIILKVLDHPIDDKVTDPLNE